MRVLYLVAYAPDRIRTRPYHLIQALRARGHEVIVATLWESEDERRFLEELKAEGVKVIAFPLTKLRIAGNLLLGLFSGEPLQGRYSWHPALLHEVQGVLQSPDLKPDIIQVEHLRGARYALRLSEYTATLDNLPPIVWDSVDCISYLYEQAARASRSLRGRLMTAFELSRTRRYERILLENIGTILVTSKNDKRAYQRLTSGDASNVTVATNGVDLEYFTPSNEPREPNTIVFSGKMSFHANVTAVYYLLKEIMPSVWQQEPDVQVWLVGKAPPKEIRGLARGNDRVKVTGMVSDIRPYLRRASISVAPLTYGVGIQNKVLEAMACATPVVASPQAISALDVKEGRDVVVAKDPNEFAEEILRLLSDETACNAIGKNGRAYVSEKHDWGTIAFGLEAVYREATQRHGNDQAYPPTDTSP